MSETCIALHPVLPFLPVLPVLPVLHYPSWPRHAANQLNPAVSLLPMSIPRQPPRRQNPCRQRRKPPASRNLQQNPFPPRQPPTTKSVNARRQISPPSKNGLPARPPALLVRWKGGEKTREPYENMAETEALA